MNKNRLSYEQFKSHLSNLSPDGNFTFGKNWLDYVNTRLSIGVVESHLSSLVGLYRSIGFSVSGKSIIDIGCGSGLSSLCFALQEASKIISIDIDDDSVSAANELRLRTPPKNKKEWTVHKSSVFDLRSDAEKFDIVYSWGVLHHTGNVWEAIRKCRDLVAPDGLLHLALYRSGDRYSEHLRQKIRFADMDREEKCTLLYQYLDSIFMSKGASVFDSDERGTNRFHDALDWFGGFPYEVVDPDVLCAYLANSGFKKLFFRDASQGGCFTYIGRLDTTCD
jgi:2-polyprenyl-6-hydroxyphenyl methylase/3-demethylubiquinone-9 3-methyltransferase